MATQLRRHRAEIGSRWRKLPPERQALLVLAHLRNGETYASLAGFGVGVARAYRYVTEVVEVLAAIGHGRSDAIHTARVKVFVILDGTLISIDRIHHQLTSAAIATFADKGNLGASVAVGTAIPRS